MYAFLYDVHGHLLMFDEDEGFPKTMYKRTMGDLKIYCNYELDEDLWEELFAEAAAQCFDPEKYPRNRSARG